MKTYELIAPCHFGLEAVLKREIDDLGYDISKTEDGRVTFIGDMEALCRANVFLRSGGYLPRKYFPENNRAYPVKGRQLYSAHI